MKRMTNDSIAPVKPKATVQQSEGVALKTRVIVIALGTVFSFSILITPIECITLSPVYWNLSNPMYVYIVGL